MDDHRKWRARIPPTSGRGQHTFSGGDTYERAKGWYAITDAQKEQLAKVKLHDMSPVSEPLFQIVTPAEAAAIDKIENAKARGTARHGVDPKTGQPLGDEGDELTALRDELAAAHANGERNARELSATRAELHGLHGKLDTLLGFLAGNPELAAQFAGGKPPASKPAEGGEGKAERGNGKAEKAEKGDDKPTRPGARGGGGKAEKGDNSGPGGGNDAKAASTLSKPAEGGGEGGNGPLASQGVDGTAADPTGAKAAAEGIDSNLRAEGATITR